MSVLEPVIDYLDVDTRRIHLLQGVTEYHPVDDLYKEVRNLRRTNEAYRKTIIPMSAAGNIPKGAGKFTPRYVTFNEGWKVVPFDEQSTIYITGEQITDDEQSGPACLDMSTLVNSVIVHYEPPSAEIVRDEASLAAINHMSFNNMITVDVDNGYNKTTFAGEILKLGNPEFPVDNIPEAVEIANYNGFSTLNVRSNVVLDTGDDISNFSIIGINPTQTHITVNDGALTLNAEFKECTITGILDGGSVIRTSVVDGITYLNGFVYQSVLTDSPIILGGGSAALFLDCYSGVQGFDTPTINMNGTGQSLGVRGYTGGLKITNRTGTDPISIDFNSGHCKIDSSCTAGAIVVRGSCKITDESPDTCYVDKVGSISNYSVAESTWTEVYVNPDSTWVGTDYPAGTTRYPVTNIDDAILIANRESITKIHLQGTHDLNQSIEGFIFLSDVYKEACINFNGQDVDGSSFSNLCLQGTIGTGEIFARNCLISGVRNIAGALLDCSLVGDDVENKISLAPNTWTFVYSGMGNSGEIIIDMNVSGNIQFANTILGIQLVNMNDPLSTVLKYGQGYIKATPTVLQGNIRWGGDSSFIDQGYDSDAVLLVDDSVEENVRKAIWSDDLSEFTQGTAGDYVKNISFIEKKIYINTESVTNGDGKSSNPFNNISDAVDYSESVGWRSLVFLSDATLDRTLKNFIVEGVGLPTIDINGQNIDKSEFSKVKLSGHQVGTITSKEVVLLSGYSGMDGIYKECGIIGDISLADNCFTNITSASSLFTSNHSANSINFGSDSVLNVRKYSGYLKLTNVSTINSLATVQFSGGHLELDSTCTSGTITGTGISVEEFIDNSTGSVTHIHLTPNEESISDQVWDESLLDHTIDGSTGKALGTSSSGGVDINLLADAIWDEAVADHQSAGSTGEALTTGSSSGPSAEEISVAVWNEDLTGHSLSDSAGKQLQDVRKISTNKAEVTDNLVTIYDDDGTSVLYQFNISDDQKSRVPA